MKPVEIARQLNTSRQFVHLTLSAADAKVSDILLDVARSNKIDVQILDVKKGILVGHHHGLGTRAVVSLSGKLGVQVWHWYENLDACDACEQAYNCRDYLLVEAEELGVQISDEERLMQPSKLARVLFSRLIPGLEP